MKPNALISCAVATAIAAAAGTAHATNITTFSTHTNVEVFISGSTAVDNTIAGEIQNSSLNICQGTVDEYEDAGRVLDSTGTPINSAIEYMYYCEAGSAAIAQGVPTGDYLLVFKESTAGSVHGAQPLIDAAKGNATDLTFLNPQGADVQKGTCADFVSNSTNGGTTGNDSACTAGDFLQNVIPTGGVADVEASLLRVVPGDTPLSASDIGTYLSSAPGLDVVWGVSVDKNLYYALQSAENLTSTCPGGNLDSPQCAPSLSKEDVAAIFTGKVSSWTQLGLTNPSGDNNVYLCRRDDGSGTEASFEAYFTGARCASSTSGSSESMVKEDGHRIIESASNGNVLRCLDAFDQGGIAVSPYNGDYSSSNFAVITPTGGQWAVGVTTTEDTAAQQASWSDTLRMVAIDGVLPTLANVVNGFDPYFSTDAWYTVKSGATAAIPTGAPLAGFKAIQADIGHPAAMHLVDLNYENVWGDGGDLAPASLFGSTATYTYPVTSAEAVANPINLWTKASSGSVDNCDVPVLAVGKGSVEGTLLGSGPDVNQ